MREEIKEYLRRDRHHRGGDEAWAEPEETGSVKITCNEMMVEYKDIPFVGMTWEGIRMLRKL